MASFVDATISNYSLSPSERKNRQEIMEAMSTVQQALKLLTATQNEFPKDLKSRQIVISSHESLAKIQTYVEKTFSSVNSSHQG
ncbi:MAG: hypothetical protein NT027_09885 [Proteobacteria bacterium]|nr:hypothetical protein [Pseudomonadota bacterium]